jgi:DNA-nicking Smr family endonuclease
MLDSVEEAQQLCTMHGYATSSNGGAPVVLLQKVRHW